MDKNKVTLSGKDPEPGTEHIGAPAPIDPATGMHKDYWILSDEERAKGFIRPVRRTYKHLKCGGVTSMNHKIAETYAAQPTFYGATFCVQCGTHYRVGEQGEFIWVDDGTKVGT